MATIPEALALALEHHNAGRLQTAEQIYRQILAVQPDQVDALHLLGFIAHQVGKHEVAIEYISRAIRLHGTEAAFHHNLGKAYRALRQVPEAIASFQRAVQLKPDFADAHNNLGVALNDQGQVAEAIANYRQALQLKPDYVQAHNNLGNVLKEQGQVAEAIACYRRALQLKPHYATAHNNLGTALRGEGQVAEAIDCYQRALQLKPDFAEAHNNLGVALKDQGQVAEAIACYQRALQLKPDFAEAHNNLGVALKDQGQVDEPITNYRKALQLKPDYVEAHYNLANSLKDQRQLPEAIASYQRALQLKPDHLVSLQALIHELQHLCRWNDLRDLSQRVIESLVKVATRGSGNALAPFSFLALPTPTTAEQQRQCAEKCCQLNSVAPIGLPRPVRSPSKITLGYLSADFHAHATAYLIAELFEKHDRAHFSVLGYSYGRDDDSAMRQRLVKALDRFVDLKHASFAEAARRIAADGVDILIDLKGYTVGARTQILAHRPAPIQVNYLGFPGTMGAPFMDYILVDDFVVPPDQQPFFTEKLVHLPGCYQVNDSQREISAHTPARTECGLPEKGFIFCCFNNSYKITPEVFAVWMGLLKAIPGSVLWLLEVNRFAPANLRREAELRGVAAERLVFAPRLPLPEHLARHRLADLFLDTFPVNAHTTASDALWAGCPVLTMAGETFVSRVAGSLLRTLGLPELITTSIEEYGDMALRLARDADLLADLGARLQANRHKSRLFDAGQFARSLERAYTTMWEIHASGEQPHAFALNPM